MRALTWDGYPNVRDLGGLPTPLSSTGATSFGRVARGPRRELLSSRGWADARSWGLRHVVDLRCADEVGHRDGDPDVEPSAHEGVAVVDSAIEDHDDPEFRRICFPILDSPEYWPHHWRLQPARVRATLEVVSDAGPGVLVQCSAGRDRTGMVSALLLGNAGVPPEVVAADYADSVRAMIGVASHAPTADRQQDWSVAEADAWVALSAPLVADAAARADEAFDVVGLSARHRRRLRDLLTVESSVEPAVERF